MAGNDRVGILSVLRGKGRPPLLRRQADLVLAGAVVVTVAMLILPLPSYVLDLLIACNIAGAITLLLVTIYVGDALKIATFPTLLLLTTLFRLALEVSATRLILLHGHAGEVIQAFGRFVAGGNVLVGLVLFAILTVIQVLVVAKGAERVAEVGARFTLDAMPGKQMAIDAELRAGHIDQTEARRRRAQLTRESQFFGAMDGAMKFVKGDALAGVVVLLVNIIGGFAIGVVQRGLDVATAAKTYTVLTIGEGLVAQIPALVISTAAGILVTRVSSDEGAALGGEVGAQVLAHPKALGGAGVLMGGLALVPGLPTLPFLLLGAGLTILGVRTARSLKQATPVLPAAVRGKASEAALLLATPLSLDLAPALAQRLAPEPDGGRLVREVLPQVRDAFFLETGVPVPAIPVRGGITDLPVHGFRVRLNEVPVHTGEVPPDRLQQADVVLAEALTRVLRRHAHELVSIEETQRLLEGLERTHPALVREVVPKLISPVLLTDVLRRLAQEGISLRGMRDILGALAEWAPAERDPVALTEQVRAALRRQITHKHAGPDGSIAAYLLDGFVEDTIREAIQRTPTGSFLALEPVLARDVLLAVARAIPKETRGAVILTGADIRRFVRRLVETEHPHVAVLSFQELAPEARIAPVGRIAV
jgi:type III secretion protein V